LGRWSEVRCKDPVLCSALFGAAEVDDPEICAKPNVHNVPICGNIKYKLDIMSLDGRILDEAQPMRAATPKLNEQNVKCDRKSAEHVRHHNKEQAATFFSSGRL